MSDNMQKLNDVIEHYKRNIGRATEANDNEKIMKCILKLSRLPITVQNLQKTGIGRVVNSLRKYDGDIGESAKSLVVQWKNVVKIEESENFYQRDENSDEEHHDVSSSNDNEELQINQSITSSVASTSYYSNNNNNKNETEASDENIDISSDHGSHHRSHSKSKYKKSKKDKDSKKDKESKKRKESFSTSTDDQGESHISKKVKREHKHESVKVKKEYEKSEIASTSHKDNSDYNSEENIKNDKKSSHSDKRKDKHKSSHRSESKSKSHKDKSESKSDYKDKSDSKKKSKDKVKEDNKPSTSSAASSNKTFEEALLGIAIGKKKQVKSKGRDRLSRSSSSERESSPISTGLNLAPLNLDPEELIANYKPLPTPTESKKRKSVEDTDQLAKIMTTKNMRTKVYSGNKSTIYSEVPRLLDFCVQTIKENLDALEYTGGVPFIILEPILKHATPDQLYTLEHYNDYLIEDTGVLWEYHCKKEFRNKNPEKNESWRDFYIRCLEERETKLAKLRKNINANQAASTPVRKTQLAYVDTVVKPPRGIAKKQAKYNTATNSKRNILNKSMMGGNSSAEALSANNRSTTMATGVPIALTSAHSPSPSLKKKKAPLMQKALQLIKSTRRR